jgi:hypothetical protein
MQNEFAPGPSSATVLEGASSSPFGQDLPAMPGLKLTPVQAARLWNLDAAASARLLESLADAGVVYRAHDGSYVLLFAR